MLGSITASGQQDLSRLEDLEGIERETCRIWALGPGRMMPFWCEVRLFGLGFGVRCAVFGVDFGARCAVFGLDFGARNVVRRFWGRFRCTVRRFWARFWCAVRRFWVRFWCAVCGAPILGPICARCAFLGWFLVCGAPFLGSILVQGGVWCADFGADFVARCAFWLRFWRVAFLGSILGSILVRGALMLGSITASGQQDLSKHEHFAFWRFVGHLLVDLKTSWQPSSKQ